LAAVPRRAVAGALSNALGRGRFRLLYIGLRNQWATVQVPPHTAP
jgi:hypothetical protein